MIEWVLLFKAIAIVVGGIFGTIFLFWLLVEKPIIFMILFFLCILVAGVYFDLLEEEANEISKIFDGWRTLAS